MANQYINKLIIDGDTKFDISSDTVIADKLASGYTAHDKTGASITGTNTYDADTSDASASASEILTGSSAYVNGVKLNGTMPNRGAIDETISTKTEVVTVSQGYHDGSGTVKIDETEQAKLIGANIKMGVEVLGVTGTLEPSSDVTAQAKTATPTFAQQAIMPDDGIDYLSQVTISAIPVTYVDNAQGGQTVTIG